MCVFSVLGFIDIESKEEDIKKFLVTERENCDLLSMNSQLVLHPTHNKCH